MNFNRKIILTDDGSSTLFLPEWNEHYHSKHGAIQEAYHVFIKNGLDFMTKKELAVLEIGLGTGLNALITFLESSVRNINIFYTGIEAYPIKEQEFKLLNYPELLPFPHAIEVHKNIFYGPWEKAYNLSDHFVLTKKQLTFQQITEKNQFDLIYFDAFGPRVQPELWTGEMFDRMYNALKDQGILVTYSAKGSVRRAMQEVGFLVEKLPGPPGKREMLRGKKMIQ